LQADLLQGLFHLVEFEWLDDGLDFLHDPLVLRVYLVSGKGGCVDGQELAWLMPTAAAK
jgi:hypothetical protein